ncbi:imm11 family protein [Pyxidicoccus sp. 3LFB2]
MAKMRYFRLKEDMQSGNWDLGDPLDAQGQEVDDPYVFRAGRPVHVTGRLTIPVGEPGRRLDFCTAGVGVAPIVHVRVASIFTELAPDDVQIIPVDIQGQPDQYLILVATKLIRCIDDAASEEVRYWKPEHGQPERVGDYKSVMGLRIDPTQVGDAKVFRTRGWNLALIVSEDIKVALERARVSGATFTPV